MKQKIAIIKLWFSEKDFNLDKITPEYIKRVLEEKGILTATAWTIDVIPESEGIDDYSAYVELAKREAKAEKEIESQEDLRALRYLETKAELQRLKQRESEEYE
jgi:hypothetical protein